jgi:hypothetical protein
MSLENVSFEQTEAMAALTKQLSDNPSTRKEFLRLAKMANPDLPIPELEIEDKTNAAINLMRQENEKLHNKIREKEAIEDLQGRRNSLLKKGLVDSEDDISEVEKVMLDKGITNHEAGAEYWKWMKQAAQPTPSGYNPNFMKQFDLSKYYQNAQTAAREEASKALQEVRGLNNQRRPIGI